MISVARSLLIAAPAERVYAAYLDFATWSAWVPHFHELTPLQDGELALGHRARVRERFSIVPTVWEVTELAPGRSFAWTSSTLPGLRLTVDHVAEANGVGALATLALHVEGPLAPVAGPVAVRLSRRTFDRSLVALRGVLEG